MSHPIRVIPYKLMVHPDGRTASLTGAHPGAGFEAEQRGWTCENSDGTRGRGHPPWKFFRAAQAYVDAHCPPEARQADVRGDDPTTGYACATKLQSMFEVALDGRHYRAMVDDFGLTCEPSVGLEVEFSRDVQRMVTNVLGTACVEAKPAGGHVWLRVRVPEGEDPENYRKLKTAALVKGLAECLDRAGLAISEALKAQG